MVSLKDVEQVAKIARLELNEKELERYTKEFDDILALFEVLDSAETDEAFSLSTTTQELREDIPISKDNKEEALKLAPHKNENYFIGPNTL